MRVEELSEINMKAKFLVLCQTVWGNGFTVLISCDEKNLYKQEKRISYSEKILQE